MNDSEKWRKTRCKAVGMGLEAIRNNVESALYAVIIDTMFKRCDSTPEQIKEARIALNPICRILEQYVARVAGCGPWAISRSTCATAGRRKCTASND